MYNSITVGSKVEVVSLGTGSKCIGQGKMSKEGKRDHSNICLHLQQTSHHTLHTVVYVVSASQFCSEQWTRSCHAL